MRCHFGAEFIASFCDLLFFSSDSAGSADLINSWVAENTARKITQIIPPGILDSMTRLVLVNAVYFKGDWSKKFDPYDTKEADFHVSQQETVRVKLMHLPKPKFSYGANQELNTQAIELPYAGDRLSMIILLPDPSGLQKLEASLTADDLLNVESKFQMSKQEARVWLPKFHLDEKLGLTGLLKAMGMTDAFHAGQADFSGMDGTKELYVSEVNHCVTVYDYNQCNIILCLGQQLENRIKACFILTSLLRTSS